jgi:hypothetical protein
MLTELCHPLKWFGLSVFTVNMKAKNHHVIEANAHQCGDFFFKEREKK